MGDPSKYFVIFAKPVLLHLVDIVVNFLSVEMNFVIVTANIVLDRTGHLLS